LTRVFIRRFMVSLPLVGLLVGCGSSSTSAPSDAWVGKTFMLDTPALPKTYWVKPSGFGSDIGAYVPQFLIGVEKGTGDNLTINLAAAQDGVQDLCVKTTQVTASGAHYPNIEIVAADFPMRIYDSHALTYVSTTGRDVTFKNLLPGNTDPSIAELDATLDVAELYPLFWQIPDATKDSVCATFASYGVSCATCSFDNQPYCLSIEAVQVSTTQAPTPIQTVTAPSCS
jgi:hypothetical protein